MEQTKELEDFVKKLNVTKEQLMSKMNGMVQTFDSVKKKPIRINKKECSLNLSPNGTIFISGLTKEEAELYFDKWR